MAQRFYDENSPVNYKPQDTYKEQEPNPRSSPNGYAYRHNNGRTPAPTNEAEDRQKPSKSEKAEKIKPKLRKVLRRTQTQWECLIGSKLAKERR